MTLSHRMQEAVRAVRLGRLVVLGQAILRGLELNCGCFGSMTPAWFDQPAVALVRAAAVLRAPAWLFLHPATPVPAGR